jgi:hypothetical protein
MARLRAGRREPLSGSEPAASFNIEDFVTAIVFSPPAPRSP